MTGWIHQCAAYWRSGGLLLLPMALVSFGIWGLFARSRETMLRVLQDLERLQQALDPNARRSNVGGMQSVLAGRQERMAVLFRGAIADAFGRANPERAFTLRENACMDPLRRDLVVMGALTSIAPLLGLLGTVMGMIQTFDAGSVFGGEPETRVAAGISRALITTQFGLVVSLPGVFGMARLQRLLRYTETRLALLRIGILNVLLRERKDARR